MISAVICHQTGQRLEVDTWIMSCRVLGRCVEEAMLQCLVAQARLKGITEIVGRYIPTARNGLVRDHFAKLGFERIEEQPGGETTWRLAVEGYCNTELPLTVDLRRQPDLAAASLV